ncbi:MAG: hypothetical protein AB1472_02560, partial [Candidatus Omnitrophota bacterium]
HLQHQENLGTALRSDPGIKKVLLEGKGAVIYTWVEENGGFQHSLTAPAEDKGATRHEYSPAELETLVSSGLQAYAWIKPGKIFTFWGEVSGGKHHWDTPEAIVNGSQYIGELRVGGNFALDQRQIQIVNYQGQDSKLIMRDTQPLLYGYGQRGSAYDFIPSKVSVPTPAIEHSPAPEVTLKPAKAELVDLAFNAPDLTAAISLGNEAGNIYALQASSGDDTQVITFKEGRIAFEPESQIIVPADGFFFRPNFGTANTIFNPDGSFFVATNLIESCLERRFYQYNAQGIPEIPKGEKPIPFISYANKQEERFLVHNLGTNDVQEHLRRSSTTTILTGGEHRLWWSEDGFKVGDYEGNLSRPGEKLAFVDREVQIQTPEKTYAPIKMGRDDAPIDKEGNLHFLKEDAIYADLNIFQTVTRGSLGQSETRLFYLPYGISSLAPQIPDKIREQITPTDTLIVIDERTIPAQLEDLKVQAEKIRESLPKDSPEKPQIDGFVTPLSEGKKPEVTVLRETPFSINKETPEGLSSNSLALQTLEFRGPYEEVLVSPVTGVLSLKGNQEFTTVSPNTVILRPYANGLGYFNVGPNQTFGFVNTGAYAKGVTIAGRYQIDYDKDTGHLRLAHGLIQSPYIKQGLEIKDDRIYISGNKSISEAEVIAKGNWQGTLEGEEGRFSEVVQGPRSELMLVTKDGLWSLDREEVLRHENIQNKKTERTELEKDPEQENKDFIGTRARVSATDIEGRVGIVANAAAKRFSEEEITASLDSTSDEKQTKLLKREQAELKEEDLNLKFSLSAGASGIQLYTGSGSTLYFAPESGEVGGTGVSISDRAYKVDILRLGRDASQGAAILHIDNPGAGIRGYRGFNMKGSVEGLVFGQGKIFIPSLFGQKVPPSTEVEKIQLHYLADVKTLSSGVFSPVEDTYKIDPTTDDGAQLEPEWQKEGKKSQIVTKRGKKEISSYFSSKPTLIYDRQGAEVIDWAETLSEGSLLHPAIIQNGRRMVTPEDLVGGEVSPVWADNHYDFIQFNSKAGQANLGGKKNRTLGVQILGLDEDGKIAIKSTATYPGARGDITQYRKAGISQIIDFIDKSVKIATDYLGRDHIEIARWWDTNLVGYRGVTKRFDFVGTQPGSIKLGRPYQRGFEIRGSDGRIRFIKAGEVVAVNIDAIYNGQKVKAETDVYVTQDERGNLDQRLGTTRVKVTQTEVALVPGPMVDANGRVIMLASNDPGFAVPAFPPTKTVTREIELEGALLPRYVKDGQAFKQDGYVFIENGSDREYTAPGGIVLKGNVINGQFIPDAQPISGLKAQVTNFFEIPEGSFVDPYGRVCTDNQCENPIGALLPGIYTDFEGNTTSQLRFYRNGETDVRVLTGGHGIYAVGAVVDGNFKPYETTYTDDNSREHKGVIVQVVANSGAFGNMTDMEGLYLDTATGKVYNTLTSQGQGGETAGALVEATPGQYSYFKNGSEVEITNAKGLILTGKVENGKFDITSLVARISDNNKIQGLDAEGTYYVDLQRGLVCKDTRCDEQVAMIEETRDGLRAVKAGEQFNEARTYEIAGGKLKVTSWRTEVVKKEDGTLDLRSLDLLGPTVEASSIPGVRKGDRINFETLSVYTNHGQLTGLWEASGLIYSYGKEVRFAGVGEVMAQPLAFDDNGEVAMHVDRAVGKSEDGLLVLENIGEGHMAEVDRDFYLPGADGTKRLFKKGWYIEVSPSAGERYGNIYRRESPDSINLEIVASGKAISMRQGEHDLLTYLPVGETILSKPEVLENGNYQVNAYKVEERREEIVTGKGTMVRFHYDLKSQGYYLQDVKDQDGKVIIPANSSRDYARNITYNGQHIGAVSTEGFSPFLRFTEEGKVDKEYQRAALSRYLIDIYNLSSQMPAESTNLSCDPLTLIIDNTHAVECTYTHTVTSIHYYNRGEVWEATHTVVDKKITYLVDIYNPSNTIEFEYGIPAYDRSGKVEYTLNEDGGIQIRINIPKTALTGLYDKVTITPDTEDGWFRVVHTHPGGIYTIRDNSGNVLMVQDFGASQGDQRFALLISNPEAIGGNYNWEAVYKNPMTYTPLAPLAFLGGFLADGYGKTLMFFETNEHGSLKRDEAGRLLPLSGYALNPMGRPQNYATGFVGVYWQTLTQGIPQAISGGTNKGLITELVGNTVGWDSGAVDVAYELDPTNFSAFGIITALTMYGGFGVAATAKGTQGATTLLKLENVANAMLHLGARGGVFGATFYTGLGWLASRVMGQSLDGYQIMQMAKENMAWGILFGATGGAIGGTVSQFAGLSNAASRTAQFLSSPLGRTIGYGAAGGITNVVRGYADSGLGLYDYDWSNAAIDFGIGALLGGLAGRFGGNWLAGKPGSQLSHILRTQALMTGISTVGAYPSLALNSAIDNWAGKEGNHTSLPDFFSRENLAYNLAHIGIGAASGLVFGGGAQWLRTIIKGDGNARIGLEGYAYQPNQLLRALIRAIPNFGATMPIFAGVDTLLYTLGRGIRYGDWDLAVDQYLIPIGGLTDNNDRIIENRYLGFWASTAVRALQGAQMAVYLGPLLDIAQLPKSAVVSEGETGWLGRRISAFSRQHSASNAGLSLINPSLAQKVVAGEAKFLGRITGNNMNKWIAQKFPISMNSTFWQEAKHITAGLLNIPHQLDTILFVAPTLSAVRTITEEVILENVDMGIGSCPSCEKDEIASNIAFVSLFFLPTSRGATFNQGRYEEGRIGETSDAPRPNPIVDAGVSRAPPVGDLSRAVIKESPVSLDFHQEVVIPAIDQARTEGRVTELIPGSDLYNHYVAPTVRGLERAGAQAEVAALEGAKVNLVQGKGPVIATTHEGEIFVFSDGLRVGEGSRARDLKKAFQAAIGHEAGALAENPHLYNIRLEGAVTGRLVDAVRSPFKSQPLLSQTGLRSPPKVSDLAKEGETFRPEDLEFPDTLMGRFYRKWAEIFHGSDHANIPEQAQSVSRVARGLDMLYRDGNFGVGDNVPNAAGKNSVIAGAVIDSALHNYGVRQVVVVLRDSAVRDQTAADFNGIRDSATREGINHTVITSEDVQGPRKSFDAKVREHNVKFISSHDLLTLEAQAKKNRGWARSFDDLLRDSLFYGDEGHTYGRQAPLNMAGGVSTAGDLVSLSRRVIRQVTEALRADCYDTLHQHITQRGQVVDGNGKDTLLHQENARWAPEAQQRILHQFGANSIEELQAQTNGVETWAAINAMAEAVARQNMLVIQNRAGRYEVQMADESRSVQGVHESDQLAAIMAHNVHLQRAAEANPEVLRSAADVVTSDSAFTASMSDIFTRLQRNGGRALLLSGEWNAQAAVSQLVNGFTDLNGYRSPEDISGGELPLARIDFVDSRGNLRPGDEILGISDRDAQGHANEFSIIAGELRNARQDGQVVAVIDTREPIRGERLIVEDELVEYTRRQANANNSALLFLSPDGRNFLYTPDGASREVPVVSLKSAAFERPSTEKPLVIFISSGRTDGTNIVVPDATRQITLANEATIGSKVMQGNNRIRGTVIIVSRDSTTGAVKLSRVDFSRVPDVRRLYIISRQYADTPTALEVGRIKAQLTENQVEFNRVMFSRKVREAVSNLSDKILDRLIDSRHISRSDRRVLEALKRGDRRDQSIQSRQNPDPEARDFVAQVENDVNRGADYLREISRIAESGLSSNKGLSFRQRMGLRAFERLSTYAKRLLAEEVSILGEGRIRIDSTRNYSQRSLRDATNFSQLAEIIGENINSGNVEAYAANSAPRAVVARQVAKEAVSRLGSADAERAWVRVSEETKREVAQELQANNALTGSPTLVGIMLGMLPDDEKDSDKAKVLQAALETSQKLRSTPTISEAEVLQQIYDASQKAIGQDETKLEQDITPEQVGQRELFLGTFGLTNNNLGANRQIYAAVGELLGQDRQRTLSREEIASYVRPGDTTTIDVVVRILDETPLRDAAHSVREELTRSAEPTLGIIMGEVEDSDYGPTVHNNP